MTPFVATAFDLQMMARALKLAEQGVYTTTPNPNVGCVLVDSQQQIVGEGFHQRAGEGHAEVNALAAAGDRARASTAYVTLEPCSHFGKTPPCCDALIAAGVSRVVVAMEDPNPKVAGKGHQRLRDAGIIVDCGVMQETAEKINRGFLKRQRTGLPFVTAKLAMSLDGKTALSNGASQWITSADARSDVQRNRAKHCAILSGSGTALADNPSLNVRVDSLPATLRMQFGGDVRQPKRILLDGRGQLSGDLKMFSLPGETEIINLSHNDDIPEQITQTQCASVAGKLDLQAVMQHLGNQQLNSVWVEAGARLVGAMLSANVVDELVVYIAPKLMGDKAFSLVELPEFTSLSQAIEMNWQNVVQVGSDLKVTLTLNKDITAGE